AVAMDVDALARKRVRRIVLARPAVEAGESLGFLPGDVHEKVDPYLRPLYDALEDMMPRDRVQKAIDNRSIEIAPLAYMRGRTLSDAFVILDEAQNATGMQMKMFLTRLGVNSSATNVEPLVVGTPAEHDVIAPFTFPVNKSDQERVREAEELAGSVKPIYQYQERALDSATIAMHTFFSSVEAAADQGGAAAILPVAKG